MLPVFPLCSLNDLAQFIPVSKKKLLPGKTLLSSVLLCSRAIGEQSDLFILFILEMCFSLTLTLLVVS